MNNNDLLGTFSPRRFLVFLTCLFIASRALAVTASNSSSVIPITGSGFELPDIAAQSFQYTPESLEWVYSGGAGISDNGSPFTNCNPTAPEGQQVLFLQQAGRVQTEVSIPTPGAYRVSFRGAQRGCINTPQGQSIRVSIGGKTLGSVRPAGNSYQLLYSAVLWLQQGSYSLRLEGANSEGDNTAFIDDIQLERLPLWSEPETWQEGRPPGVGSEVVIPAGTTVVMDNANAANVIRVQGILTTPLNRDFSLNTNEVHVMDGGLLELGRSDAPFSGKGTITLMGDNPAADSKQIRGMNGSRIELHGRPQLSWTQLGETAAIGDNTITLKDAVNWNAGDRIVIASTDFDMNHAEEFTIIKVSSDKRTLTLDNQLTHRHFGELQRYTDNGQSWNLDERAEVGLLSRNLLVQGDEDSERLAYGGNIMVMTGAVGRVSNVELSRMGQRLKLGRYPFHWHLAGDASGQFIRNSSIHHTYNRAITIHGTDNAVVADNVCYDNLGHAVFMEDGNETGNIIVRNLGLVTRKPSARYALLPSDTTNGRLRNASGPATFWITHPHNTVRNNHAAGSDGSGFWFAFHQNPSSPVFEPGLNPNLLNLPAGAIDNNTAHSNFHGWLLGMAPMPGDLSQSPNLNNDYMPRQEPVVNGLTVFKNYLGM